MRMAFPSVSNRNRGATGPNVSFARHQPCGSSRREHGRTGRTCRPSAWPLAAMQRTPRALGCGVREVCSTLAERPGYRSAGPGRWGGPFSRRPRAAGPRRATSLAVETARTTGACTRQAIGAHARLPVLRYLLAMGVGGAGAGRGGQGEPPPRRNEVRLPRITMKRSNCRAQLERQAFLPTVPAHCAMSFLPTEVEPVKVTFAATAGVGSHLTPIAGPASR